MALTTLLECKAYLGISPSDTAQDALIEILRPAMEELIIAYCDTDFEEKAIDKEMHDGIQSDAIVPHNFPITDMQEVWLDTDAAGENGILMAEGLDYFVDDDGSVILVNRQPPFRRGSIKIKYTHGYATTPPTIKLCVYQCVKAEIQRKKRGTEDVSSRGKGDESESYGGAWDKRTGLPSQIMSKLETFRAREFPGAGMAQRNT